MKIIMKSAIQIPSRLIFIKTIVAFLAVALIMVWLLETPGGLLGKADAIGYAVCHRIASRSFFISDREFPLCARCTGMYLGTMLGLIFQGKKGRFGGMPNLKIAIILGIFVVAFGIDGVNSYIHFFPKLPSLYTSQNWLRLLTGTGLGLGMAAVLAPIFNQTVWVEYQNSSPFANFWQFAGLVAAGLVLDGIVLWQNPLILYPLALISTITILVILTMIYSMIWIMIFHKENQYQTWKSAWFPILAGFTTALAQIAVMDLGRYLLTGTWNGFNLG
jgi:uncharacterized membrane protein